MRAAVVDPWGGGALLAPALRRRGHECLAVLSDAGIAARLGAAPPSAADFVEVLTHQDDAAATAERLRERGVELVLAGCETGVLLADQLDDALGLPGNGLALSPARRDKGLMARAAAEAGLAVPQQIRSADVEEILAWIVAAAGGNKGPQGQQRLQGQEKPETLFPAVSAVPEVPCSVVIKPSHSLDSDGVALCSSADEVRAACAALLGRTNQAGLINETVLVQERLDGDQYAVDTVSRDGRHLLAGIWRYSRPRVRPGAPAY
ncbi:MAG TPA: ATP-grasp domain-containing protein, partial [Thermoanaerobaculia bacterium]|nr:ATP-grasp domain-containing protein [Thermoanaerobaculia bacterium]